MSSTTASGVQWRLAGAKPVDAKSLPQHLQCDACGRAAYSASQTPHGCRLCQLCVADLPASGVVRCPGRTEACVDEEEEIDIGQGSCMPDLATRREIGKVQVWCLNSDCKQKMKWRELESHIGKCEYEYVACELCRDQVQKRGLLQHKKKECKKRLVPCDKCGDPVPYCDMDAVHKNLESSKCCRKYKSTCPHCRDKGRELDRTGFVRHLAECPEKPDSCRFAHLGCQFAGKGSELRRHYRERADYHLELMDKTLRDLGAGVAASGSASANPPTPAASSSASAAGVGVGDLVEMKKNFDTMYDMFKKLQLNAANWASTMIEVEEMAAKFGSFAELRAFLKGLETASGQGGQGGQGGHGGGRSSSGGGGSGGGGGGVEQLANISRKLESVQTQLEHMEAASYNGSIVWKVALPPSAGGVLSPPFFSRRHGHKYRARLAAGADGSQLSVHLLLLRGDFDDCLDWPHVADVTFRLVNRKDRSGDVVKTMKLDSGSRRPAEADDLSVSCGVEKFASVRHLRDSGSKFLKDDSLLLAVGVEPRRRPH